MLSAVMAVVGLLTGHIVAGPLVLAKVTVHSHNDHPQPQQQQPQPSHLQEQQHQQPKQEFTNKHSGPQRPRAHADFGLSRASRGDRPDEVHHDAEAIDCRSFVKVPKPSVSFWATFNDMPEVERTVQQAKLALNVSRLVLFAGYPRSGHSIFGSLMDAHPDVTIANEFGLLRAVARHKQAPASFVFEGLLRNAIVCAHFGRTQTGYSYEVPGMFQGQWGRQGITVIGDKQGGYTTKFYLDNTEGAQQALERLKQLGKQVLVVHVLRHPLDQIATQATRFAAKMQLPKVQRGRHLELEQLKAVNLPLVATSIKARTKAAAAVRLSHKRFWQLFHANLDLKTFVTEQLGGSWLDLYVEDLIADPHTTVRAMCTLTGVVCSDAYIAACASIVLTSPRHSRTKVLWDTALLSELNSRMASQPLLARYASA